MRRAHRAVHRRIWIVLAIVLPVLLLGALAVRPQGPTETAPVRLR